jgi:hypothetical protein
VAKKLQGGFVGKVGSGGVVGKETVFICPKYEAEYALMGEKVGEPLMVPSCVIFLKAE